MLFCTGERYIELRRLFYVALTRAEQHLYISYSRQEASGKDAEPSMFIAEIQEQHILPVEKVILDKAEIDNFRILQFSTTARPEIDPAEADFTARLLDRFVMSVTALSSYLRCPLDFYYNNLIRIPSPKNEATQFGSAVHYALEQLFKKMKANEDVFPGKEIFLRDFEKEMHHHRESFTKEQFERRLEYGRQVLSDYYDINVPTFNKIVIVEKPVKNVHVEGVPVKGFMDKIEFMGKEVNVVDYKTGNPDNAKKKLYAPNADDPNGGDYWRQAVFYRLLLDHANTGWTVVSTEFDFIEPDAKKNYQKKKIYITDEDLTTVKQQVKQTWQKIQNREFFKGCGKPECHWCNFVKDNKLAVALHGDEPVEEDD